MTDGSQYGEATFILEHFAGRTGRFLDVGAFDGITLSNTRPLADLGWSGVCVEPSPPAFCQLMINYAGNARVELVNAAVAGTFNGRVRKLHVNTPDSHAADTMSTFQIALRESWESYGYPFRDIWTHLISWEELLGGVAGPPFSFVNIDVEGMNLDVFGDMPIWPEMICVENDESGTETCMRRLYPNVKVIGGNVLGWK